LDHSGVFFADDDALAGTQSVESLADSYSGMLASYAYVDATAPGAAAQRRRYS
jgi:hypothetical protein